VFAKRPSALDVGRAAIAAEVAAGINPLDALFN